MGKLRFVCGALVLSMAALGGSCQAPSLQPVAGVASPSAQSTASDPGQGGSASVETASQPSPAPDTVSESKKKTYTVPAGTKVLLQLRSAVNTKSAKPGDGVYLASTFPVVVGTRVLIPAGVYVQGVVDTVIRAGRVKGRAQLNLHFTSIIFPNGSVVEIPGIINSLPGAHDRSVDREGKVEQNSNKGHDVAEAAKIGLEGAGVGAIGGAAAGHPLEGLAIGGLGGAAVGAAVALFTRGNDINIENGTPVEMVLQRSLVLEESNLASQGTDGTGTAYSPSGNQPKPLEKPLAPHARVMCPPGGLGCQ